MITIVYGPQASGKTRNKNALRMHYGHDIVIDGVSRTKSEVFMDDTGQSHSSVPDDTLVLTNMPLAEVASFVVDQGIEANVAIIPITAALKDMSQ